MSREDATDFRLNANEQSIKEQWTVLNDIRDSLSDIKQTLAKMEAGQTKIEEHEKRIKSLETWRTLLIGTWSVLSVLGYLAWDYFKTILKHP